MRNNGVDEYMESRFGEPLHDKAFIDIDPDAGTYMKLLTPFNGVRLWRVDPFREGYTFGMKPKEVND